MFKKVLITGAGGFIGQSLGRFLSSRPVGRLCYLNRTQKVGYNVMSYTKERLDLLDREKVSKLLEKEKFDIVIHSSVYDAAPQFSNNSPDKVMEYNLRMFDNLAQCSRDYGAMLYFGSGAEHRRDNPYGLAKYMMDQVTLNKSNIYNLRLYSVYGIGTNWRYRFINNACAKVALGMPIKIPYIGKCDYLNVNDLCRVVEYYIHNYSDINKSQDICSGDVLSTEDIVGCIKEITPTTSVLSQHHISPTVSRCGSSNEDYFGCSDFSNSLPFSLTPLGEGVEELINYYKENKPNPDEFIY